MSSEEYINFLNDVLKTISVFVSDDTPILWNVSYNANSRSEYGKVVFGDINPFQVKETIIWDKTLGMNIAGTGILSRSAELIFLMCKGEKYFTNQNGGVYWNVWRVSNRDGDNMSNGHGASFPVQLPIEGIEKFSKKGSIVFDPFLGSGTTLIASDILDRKCYGSEIDPKYCDVIIQRWENHTGNKARLLNV